MTNYEEGNRVIADFMGAEWNDKLNCYWFQIPPTKYASHGWTDFQYDTSWSWLMPVVEKIEAFDTAAVDCRLTIEREECRVYYNTVGMIYEWVNRGSSKIDSCWTAIVRFIKWYNTQKTITNE